MPFLCSVRLPAPSPSSPSERLDCSEGGNTGRRTTGPTALLRDGRPFSSRPNRRNARFIGFSERNASSGAASGSTAARWAANLTVRLDNGAFRPDFARGMGNGGSLRVSGPGQPGGRHGQGAGRGLPAGPGGVRRGRRGARRKAHRDHVGGPGRHADADRERAAGADGGVARGDARAGSRSRRRSQARRAIRRRPFARRIFGAGRGRRVHASPTPRGCCASAAAPCRRRCRSAPARWRRCSGSNSMPRPRSRPKPRRARSARPPTTMAAARSWCPATRRRSSARSRSPRPRAPSAR